MDSGLEYGGALAAAVFWAFQFHLLDIVATVQFSTHDYRVMWLHESDRGLSYFQANAAIATLLAILFLMYTVNTWRASRRIGECALPFCLLLFVALFSYRMIFLQGHALSDEWYAQATEDEPWDDLHRHHLGLITGHIEGGRATIVLENEIELVLELPPAEPPSRVVTVQEHRARYSGRIRYTAGYYIPYDDLQLFLSRNTSFKKRN